MIFDQRTAGGEGASHHQWESGTRVIQGGAEYVRRPSGRYVLEAFVEQREESERRGSERGPGEDFGFYSE